MPAGLNRCPRPDGAQGKDSAGEASHGAMRHPNSRGKRPQYATIYCAVQYARPAGVRHPEGAAARPVEGAAAGSRRRPLAYRSVRAPLNSVADDCSDCADAPNAAAASTESAAPEPMPVNPPAWPYW